MPADHTIRIRVTESGNFTYDPTHLRAHAGDTIDFQYTDSSGYPGHFEVMFKDRSPGSRTHISNRTPRDKGPADDTDNRGQLQCNGQFGLFQYAAAVFDGKQVFIDVGCGDIGVDDP